MDEIFDLLDEIQLETENLRNTVNGWLGRVPGWASWVGDRIREAWDWLVARAQEFWDGLTLIVGNLGDPWKLSETGSSWNNSVGGPVSSQVQVAEAGNLNVDDTWSGEAAGAYQQRISLHKTALDKVKASLTDGLSSALDQVKTGIIIFWAAMAAALAALVAGIVTALASSATVFGIPAGILIAAGAFAVALAAIWGGGTKLKSDCMTARNTLEQKVINESAGYLDGHWPAGAMS